MDLKIYYRKVREQEAAIREDFAILVSHETPDGGRAGVMTEVPRRLAAKMIVEGRGRLATPEEAERYRQGLEEARQQAEMELARTRIYAAPPESGVRPSNPSRRRSG